MSPFPTSWLESQNLPPNATFEGLKSKKIPTTLSTQDDIKSPITALRRAVTLKTKDKKNDESRSPVKFHIMIGRHTMSSPSNQQQKVVHTLILLDSILT